MALDYDSVLHGLKVLVVDDNQDTCDLITLTLEINAIEAVAATSVGEALSVFGSFRPDLLISDIAMPSEDGYSLIQQIRSRHPSEGGLVPAIALTAYAGDMDKQRALAAGFQRHIPKPVMPDSLIEAIGEMIISDRSSLLSASA